MRMHLLACLYPELLFLRIPLVHYVIERFGRFPKWNAALGRESTEGEVEYMNSAEAQGRPY